jgi:hypothetical protein
MKLVAVPILMLLLMTQTFSHLFVVLSFRINRDYIAKNLCENRYRPKLHCKGKCVLMKKMKQEERQERESPGNLKVEVISLVISSKTFFAVTSDPDVIKTKSYYPAINTGIPVDRPADIFHPPLLS